MSIDAQIKRLEEVMLDLTFSANELIAAVKNLSDRLPLGPRSLASGLPVLTDAQLKAEPNQLQKTEESARQFEAPVNDPEPEVNTPKKIERADVSAACRALQQKDGNSDRAKKVLAQFGAKKVPDLTDAQLSDAYYAFEAAAAEEELA